MTDSTNWDEYLKTRRTNAYTDRELVQTVLAGDVLEIGCGFGDFAAWCAASGARRVAGIDPSAEAIDIAKRVCPSGEFVVAVAEKLPFPDASFDTVISLEVVEHVQSPEQMFREARRVLRPGGVLIVQTPNYPVKRLYDALYWMMRRKKTLADDPTHIQPMTFRRMRALASGAGFQIERIVGRNILGEKRVPWLARFKRGACASWVVQKMILIARVPGGKSS